MRSRAERPLRLAPMVQETIRGLHPEIKRRVRAALDSLKADPGAGKPLAKEFEGWRSWRVGKVRLIYRETRARVDVVAVGPRSSIYLDAAALIRTTPNA